jgi:septal ring factor EnvC (AmiA/AmiB activator)
LDELVHIRDNYDQGIAQRRSQLQKEKSNQDEMEERLNARRQELADAIRERGKQEGEANVSKPTPLLLYYAHSL